MNVILYLLLIALITLFVVEMRHSLKRSTAVNDITRRYEGDEDNPALIAEIFAYCNADRKLAPIIKKHNADEATFAKLFRKLRVWGDIKKGRRYVPVASFFYAYSLNWLLTHQDEDEKKTAMKMMNFLHI